MPDLQGFNIVSDSGSPARRYCHLCDAWFDNTTAKWRDAHHRQHVRDEAREKARRAAATRRENERRLRQLTRLRGETK